jgi:orotidine-5'-phosphate decarboxylase
MHNANPADPDRSVEPKRLESQPAPLRRGPPIPILALDVAQATEARALLASVPEARWVKVGLQLFTATGPDLVRELVAGGYRVFLDLKLHDIPNTVGRAVESAAALGVDLLTLHASGGRAMLSAARAAAPPPAEGGPLLLGVTLLTSLSEEEVGEAWGRSGVSAESEACRLALLARDCGIDGVVASVHEAAMIRKQAGESLRILAPGIRLHGDGRGDQTRVASPEQATRAGVDYIVVGRAVSAAAQPEAAWNRVTEGILQGVQE